MGLLLTACTNVDLAAFKEIRTWTKDLLFLSDFKFTQLYEYLVSI